MRLLFAIKLIWTLNEFESILNSSNRPVCRAFPMPAAFFAAQTAIQTESFRMTPVTGLRLPFRLTLANVAMLNQPTAQNAVNLNLIRRLIWGAGILPQDRPLDLVGQRLTLGPKPTRKRTKTESLRLPGLPANRSGLLTRIKSLLGSQFMISDSFLAIRQ